jgi:exodeoxyribonuclease VII large subunit
MQGEQSPASIIHALNTIASDIEAWDIVVIVRGGGASTDLRNFDDYSLAFHCANFPLPILAGIGHRRDISIVDMVVHTSVKTPTAAAEWLIAAMQAQTDHIDEMHARLQRAVQYAIHRQYNRLDQLRQAIRFATHSRLHSQRTQLQLWEKTIAIHSPERIYRMGYSLATANGKIVRSIQDVAPGDEMLIHTQDGRIKTRVEQE